MWELERFDFLLVFLCERLLSLLGSPLAVELILVNQDVCECFYDAAFAGLSGADHRHAESQGLTQIDDGIGVGDFCRKYSEKFLEVAVDLLYPSFEEGFALGEKHLLFCNSLLKGLRIMRAIRIEKKKNTEQ